MEIQQSIIEKVAAFIGKENIRWFRHVKGLKGGINVILRLNFQKKKIPVHPIHLREGMQIRNFLRGLPECKTWTHEDFERGWIDVIELLIKQP
ncbi:MAG TPA: hypothetical protein VFE32_17325 [Puia sp.]|jgi:hypothetical protein|nr:hypothetical protein [Puia sp.]